MHRRATNAGLTLIEVLAVTALLGLIAAVFLSRASAPTERAAFRAVLTGLEELDRRARVAARLGTPVALAFDPARQRLVAHRRFGGAFVAECLLDPEIEVDLVRDGRERVPAIHFDGCGTSPDYEILLRRHEQRARIEVAGLTGFCTRTESVP